jgi:hypothetical protein
VPILKASTKADSATGLPSLYGVGKLSRDRTSAGVS